MKFGKVCFKTTKSADCLDVNMDNLNVDNVDRFDKSSDKIGKTEKSDKVDNLNKTTDSLLSKTKTKYALKKDAYEQHKQKIYIEQL